MVPFAQRFNALMGIHSEYRLDSIEVAGHTLNAEGIFLSAESSVALVNPLQEMAGLASFDTVSASVGTLRKGMQWCSRPEMKSIAWQTGAQGGYPLVDLLPHLYILHRGQPNTVNVSF